MPTFERHQLPSLDTHSCSSIDSDAMTSSLVRPSSFRRCRRNLVNAERLISGASCNVGQPTTPTTKIGRHGSRQLAGLERKLSSVNDTRTRATQYTGCDGYTRFHFISVDNARRLPPPFRPLGRPRARHARPQNLNICDVDGSADFEAVNICGCGLFVIWLL